MKNIKIILKKKKTNDVNVVWEREVYWVKAVHSCCKFHDVQKLVFLFDT